MKTAPSVWITTAGISFAFATIGFKKFSPDFLGRSFPLIASFDIIGSALLGLGLFLALRDLFLGAYRPWIAFAAVTYAFLGAVYVTVSPATVYVVFTNTDRILSRSVNEILPRLVDQARTSDTQAKRMLMAQRAYLYCGVLIAYRQDDGSYIEYSPTAADTAFSTRFQANERRNHSLEDQIIGGQIRQIPYVLAFQLTSFALVLLIALCWVAVQRSKELSTAAATPASR